jgi:hypothetical protein
MTLEPDSIRNVVEASDHGPKKISTYLENNMEKKI